jgi:hypothetical protein
MELVNRIGTTDFCLSFDLEKYILYLRLFIGENAGAMVAQARVPGALDKVSPRSQPMMSLKTKVDTANLEKLQALDKKYFKSKMDDALMELQDQWFTWLDGAEERAEDERRQKEEEEQEALEELISEGAEIIDEMKHPILCIAWLIDWLTAGERVNILYAFLAYSSQVILKNPISVIGLGEGGSGKTHIQEVALSLIPDEYVMTIKSTTDAALFGYCDTNPNIFDGKIVNIGDMGGKNDHEEAQQFKNAMKEMQSDGFMARVKREIGDDGKWYNKIYELFGYPCLTYTNVPGFDFEDQEKSRSVFFQPRIDNDEAVSIFKQLNRMKGTRTEEILNEWKAKIPDIKKMLITLRARMEYVNIYNPYNTFMKKYLGSSKYFKRDVDKYDGILRVITAINGYRRPLVNDTLLTTKEDIVIFIDLLNRYHESITSNLSPGAADLLQELRDHDNDWDLYETGITVTDYMYKSVTNLGKHSVQTYFGELNAAGYIKVIDKEGRSNVYALQSTSINGIKNEIELSKSDMKVLLFNYGDEALEITQRYDIPLDIFKRNESEPYWNDFLPENL